MPDLTQGYLGPRRGNQAVVDAIFRQSPLNVGLPGHWLPRAMFTNNFMPYAKTHWAYDGSACNCEDLSSALCAFWSYIKGVKRPVGLEPLPAGEKVSCLVGRGMITRPIRVFAGPAGGNVRALGTAALDGRCLFPIHWVCKIGLTFFDPTYDRYTVNRADISERELTKPAPGIWLSIDKRYLYTHNLAAAPQFSDSWCEMDAAGWMTAKDWKAKTSRALHTRSKDLQAVDAALGAFEQQGAAALDALKTAFKGWADRNPRESAARNVDNCVSAMAGFLGVAIALGAAGGN